MKSILDPTFVYIPSACTDIRKTFDRARKGLLSPTITQEPSAELSVEHANVTICDIRTIPTT